MINDKYIEELENNYKICYLQYIKNENVDNWGSHQPLLIHLVNTIAEGPVLEFGMGDNSTPLLHLICEKQKRNLYSYDFDANWLNKFKHYENKYFLRRLYTISV